MLGLQKLRDSAPSSHDHRDELLVGHRLAEQVSLSNVAAEAYELLGVCAGFDPDSYRAVRKVVSDLDHALADIRVAFVFRTTLHE
jgi:hypothetical protein